MHKVTFCFRDDSLESINDLRNRGGYMTNGEVVERALCLLLTIEEMAAKGYSQVVLRHPVKNDYYLVDFVSRYTDSACEKPTPSYNGFWSKVKQFFWGK